MSEKEIINVITKMLEKNDDIFEETGNHVYFSKMTAETIQGLLDLYNKEKLNNLNLSEQLNKEKEKNRDLQIFVDDVKAGVYIDYPEFEENYISKDKIKEKIEELDKIIFLKRKSQIEYSTIDELIFDKKIEVLQELLEEGE